MEEEIWERGNYGVICWSVCFRTWHIGQYRSGSSVLAHSSHIGFPQFWHILSPGVGFPQIMHGSSTSSTVIVALTLCSWLIPTPLVRATRLKSLASNHSIVWSSIVIILLVRIPVAVIFFFFSGNIVSDSDIDLFFTRSIKHFCKKLDKLSKQTDNYENKRLLNPANFFQFFDFLLAVVCPLSVFKIFIRDCLAFVCCWV